MNARQKAKKYKREIVSLKCAVEILQRNNKFLRFQMLNRPNPKIETCKFKIYVPFVPVVTNTYDAFINSLYECESENAKRQLAKEIANYLIDNDLIELECDKDDIQRANIYTATLNVVRKEDVQYAKRRDTITG